MRSRNDFFNVSKKYLKRLKPKKTFTNIYLGFVQKPFMAKPSSSRS